MARPKSADASPPALATTLEAVDVSPAAKAAHCAKCDRRFVPTDGAVCPECVTTEKARREKRAGFTICRVLENVVACGVREDGHVLTNFGPGDVAEFADHDVLSVPSAFSPL